MAKMRPKVHTEKHIIQLTPTTVGLASIINQAIVFATAAPVGATNVREGATISAVFIEMWITSDDAAQGSTVVTLEKIPALAPYQTYTQSITLNGYANKKNILYTTQGLTPPNIQSGVPFIRQWFMIPKGKQRFGLGDQLILNISGISNGAVFCGQFQFKEQF